jgi:hypothetical protein
LDLEVAVCDLEGGAPLVPGPGGLRNFTTADGDDGFGASLKDAALRGPAVNADPGYLFLGAVVPSFQPEPVHTERGGHMFGTTHLAEHELKAWPADGDCTAPNQLTDVLLAEAPVETADFVCGCTAVGDDFEGRSHVLGRL